MVKEGMAAFMWGSMKYGNIHIIGNSLSLSSTWKVLQLYLSETFIKKRITYT